MRLTLWNFSVDGDRRIEMSPRQGTWNLPITMDITSEARFRKRFSNMQPTLPVGDREDLVGP